MTVAVWTYRVFGIGLVFEFIELNQEKTMVIIDVKILDDDQY
jgi:hypothetical protein